MTDPLAFHLLDWAEDDNYPAGADPWSGTPTKTEPSQEYKDIGFTPEDPASAQKLNHLLHVFAKTNNALAGSPALSFSGYPISTPDVRIAKWDPYLETWYGTGGAADVFRRTQDIWTWPASSESFAGEESLVNCLDFDFDDDGRILLALEGTADSFQFYDTVNWDFRVGFLGGGTRTDFTTSTCWDSFSDRWLQMWDSTGAALFRSDDNTAAVWSSLTPPTGLPSGARYSLSTDRNGVIVMQAFQGTNTYFSRSINGGVTWSSLLTKALGFTSTITVAISKPIWNGRYFLAWASGSTGSTKVYRSPDGLAWTEIASFVGTLRILSIAALGDVWLAAVDNASGWNFVISFDGGFKWHGTDLRPFTAHTVASNGVRFLMTNHVLDEGRATVIGLGGGLPQVPFV